MEEEALSNFSENSTTKTLDTVTQRKHAAMIERLSNLHQSRFSTKSNPDSLSTPPYFESTQSFLSRFSNSKLSIESNLTRIHQTPNPHSNPRLKSELESVSLAISDLEKLVAENSYFLPPYEVRSSLKTISDLKQTLENVTSEVIPRKKFSFRNKPTKNAPDQTNVANKTQTVNRNVDTGVIGVRIRDSPGIRGKENEVLVKDFKGGSEDIGEFTVSDLTGCEVRLTGCFRALFVHRLTNCMVYVGPVLGSILIEEVEGCVFVLASHQIRIHHAKGSDFYLRVRSRPIVEDSSGVRFAPYCLSYDGIEKDLKELNLDVETGNWANVDDFRWLRAVQSPNWSILPENERIHEINI
ncbi:hypothetical protein LguiA_003193 [Lonicera macranthoides]